MFEKTIKEPLLHFALLGLCLFGVFSWLNPSIEPDRGAIVVTKHTIEQLTTVFEKKWSRPASTAEVEKLVESYILEELYYREALAMKMDKNDTVIRRRLRQKMEFLLADASELPPPTTAQLQTYLDDHPADFLKPASYSFQQIYVDTAVANRNEKLAAIQQQFNSGVIPEGDSIDLPPQIVNTPSNQIDRLFGHAFSSQLEGVPLKAWNGPLKSGFGAHWVYLESQIPAQPPSLDEVYGDVLQAYEFDQRVLLQKSVTDSLKEKYEITIHWPKPEASRRKG